MKYLVDGRQIMYQSPMEKVKPYLALERYTLDKSINLLWRR